MNRTSLVQKYCISASQNVEHLILCTHFRVAVHWTLPLQNLGTGEEPTAFVAPHSKRTALAVHPHDNPKHCERQRRQDVREASRSKSKPYENTATETTTMPTPRAQCAKKQTQRRPQSDPTPATKRRAHPPKPSESPQLARPRCSCHNSTNTATNARQTHQAQGVKCKRLQT